MKPHLPVSLFRSLLTAVAAFPFFAYGTQGDVPAGYTSLTINAPGQIDEGTNYTQVAYLLRADSTSTSTFIWDSAATFFTDKSKEVMFTGEVSSATCNIIMRNSSRLLAVGDIAFVDLDDITVDSNNLSTNSDKNGVIHGGIFSAGSLALSTETGTEGKLKGFEDDTAKISFTKNKNIELTRNSLSYTIKEQNSILKGYAMGAAIGAAETDISGNKDVSISTNTLTIDVSGKVGTISTGFGGAVFGKNVLISNNEDVAFRDNRLIVLSSDETVAAGAAIGALGDITITDNDSVVFRGNVIRQNESYYLESLGIVSDNQGLLTVAAGSVGTVHFYDPINVDGNASFETDGGAIIFSAEYAESDLTRAANATPDAKALELSRTSVAMGTTTLHKGTMRIEKGAIYTTGAYQADDKSTLILNNGSLISKPFTGMKANQGNGETTFRSGSNLHIQGVGNSIEASAVVFEGKNTITFDISPKNATASGLSIDIMGNNGENKISFGAGITIHLTSQTSVTDDEYRLIALSPTATREGWSTSNITVTSSSNLGFTATYANLQWRNNVLYYCTTLPKLQKATWSNADGDFVWSLNAINWTENGQQYAFVNGAQATFTDTGAGTVTIEGDITPASVLVNNTEAGYYEWKAAPQGGKLTGDMILTKRGTGELKVSLANDYSGGTTVEGGTLTAGDAQAFGTGTITIDGGHLNTGTYAVTNDIILKNGQFSGTAYNGKLSISDTTNALIGENTTAESVVLKNATVTGGSFAGNTNITAADSTINAILTGNTNLTVNGNTTLVGDHTTGGTFTVKKGVLTFDGTTTADWNLEGGYLSPKNPIELNIGQSIAFNGGNLQGTLQTGMASEVTVSKESGVSNLILNGGTYTAAAPNVTLRVGGTLNILGSTTVDVSSFTDGGSYTLISAELIEGEMSNLTAKTDNRNTYIFNNNNNDLELTVEENAATLEWIAEKGEWSIKKTQEWDTDEADKQFYNRDNVIFKQGGEVVIVGEVKPNSIIVEGSEKVLMTGSGSIVGQTSLVKNGSSTLDLNATNTYEGGTEIHGGTVNAGGVASFGKGKILLTDGLLNMGSHAVTNDVEATGGEFVGTAYNGTITVNGNLSVGGKTTAKEIILESGSISNGSLDNTAIIAKTDGEVSIESTLTGTTSIQVDKGEVNLNCKNDSIGTVTVNDGTLIYTGVDALGKGDIYLNGGQMLMNNNTELELGKQKLYLSGGQLHGNTRTGNSTSIVVSKDSTITGDLVLNGGTIYFEGKETGKPAARSMYISSNGCTLTVTGALTLRADTLIYLEKGQYADGDILLEADSLTGDFSQLILEYDDGNPNTEFALEQQETEDGKVQIILDLDKVYEHENDNWVIANADLRDLLVQSNWGMFASSHAFTDALQGQRSASGAVGTRGVMAWASALYSHMSVNDDGAMNGGDSDTMGAAVGIETMVGTRSCIGLAVGVTSTDISVGNISDEMEQDATYFGIYGATVLSRLSEVSGLTLSWSAAYGSVESSPSRAASSIEWQQDSFQLNGRVDWSRSVSSTTTVNVFAGLEYFMTTSDEVDGVDSGEIRNLRAELGAGITRRYSASVLYAEARLLGDIMRDDPTPTIDGRSEEGANPGTVGAGFRVGAAYDINQFWSVGANGSVEIMGDAVSAGANIGASLKF